MNILFVSSGNSVSGLSPIVTNQGISLEKNPQIKIKYFAINGNGLLGYIKNISKLRHYLQTHSIDMIHAHYSLSALVASLTLTRVPIVASLMGSDSKMGIFWRFVIRFNYMFIWQAVIVKSEEMKIELGLQRALVLPNGVDFQKFKPIEKKRAISKLGWDRSKKHILFAANPNRFEKNYSLAKKVYDELPHGDIEMHVLIDIPNDLMPIYFNASDLIMLTSLWEGSPNVIKEAMACNRPIVSTDVGDVKKIFGDTDGCYIINDNIKEAVMKVRMSLDLFGMTTGRFDISHLDDQIIADELVSLYRTIILK
jgi:teichuronic acid biosynthesis glycosyltransferase TuaC